MSESLLVRQLGAVAVLSINDAPMNRMSLDFMDSLEREVARIAEDSTIRAVVLTAEGTNNSSVGMNLKQLPSFAQSRPWASLGSQRCSATALVAEELANMPAGAVRSMLRVIVGGAEKPLQALLAEERRAVHENQGTADAKEGMRAFLEKRKPVFNQ